MNERQIAIIKLLINKPNLNLKELSNSFDVSTRTIRNDIENINLDLHHINIPKIKNDRGILSLSLTSKEKAFLFSYFRDMEITFLSPEERLLTIIFDFLSYPEQIKIYEEQRKLQVSKSTIDKDMRKVRAYLDQFSLMLNAEHGAKIVGSEKNIRTMLQQLISKNVNLLNLMKTTNYYEENRSYEIVRTYLGKENLKKIDKLSDQFLIASRYEGNLITKAQLNLFLSIWFRRVTQKYFLIEEEEKYNFHIDKKIQNILEIFLKDAHISVPQIELAYISYIIKIFTGKEKYNLDEVTRAQLLTLQLIDFMSKKEKINYENSENLYEQLNLHLLAFLEREKHRVKVYNPLTEILKSNYSQIFDDIKDFFSNTRYKSSDDEEAFITVYFGTYYEKLIKQKKTYKIAILCNFGEATGQLLAANLSRDLNVEVLGVFGSKNSDALKQMNIDFVVKTIDFKLDMPSIKMNPLPTKSDYKRLKEFIRTLPTINHNLEENQSKQSSNILKQIIKITEKNLNIKVTSSFVDKLMILLKSNHIKINEKEVRPLIEDLLTDKKINLQITASDWHDAIEKASQPLISNGSIENSYVKAMENSVEKFGPYIVIGPHIALAHARPEEGVNKLDVSVATLKTPIEFGNKQNDPVKIIFVLAAIDNYSHLNILKAIINLINDQKKVDKLCDIDDINNFKEILFDKVKS